MEHRCLLLRIFFERFSSKTLFFTSKNKIAFLRCIFKIGSEPIWDRFGFDFGRQQLDVETAGHAKRFMHESFGLAQLPEKIRRNN